MPFYITRYNIKLFWVLNQNIFKVTGFEGKIKEKSAEKATKLNFTVFWAKYFLKC